MGNVFDAMKRAVETEKTAPAPALPPRAQPLTPQEQPRLQDLPQPLDTAAPAEQPAQEQVQPLPQHPAPQEQATSRKPQKKTPRGPILAPMIEGHPEIKPVKPRRESLPVIDKGDIRYSSALVAWHDRTGRVAEQYRALRTHLIAHFKDRPFAAIVTSAQAGEGKTVTCLNLALSLAALKDARTVVVDCDFRRGSVATLLRDSTSTGLADVLRGQMPIEQAMRPTPFPNLSVVLAGRSSPQEAPELTARSELDDIVRHLQKHFDYVLFDTPPINTLADAGMIGRLTGDALLVVRMNRTQREAVNVALQRLQPLRVRVAGLVLVGQRYLAPHYLYDEG